METPVITTQPQDASVKKGETATYTVAATETTPAYQWQIDRNDEKDEVPKTGDTSMTHLLILLMVSLLSMICIISHRKLENKEV